MAQINETLTTHVIHSDADQESAFGQEQGP